jgi:hypothetical protein
MMSSLTICLVPKLPVMLVMELPHQQQFHSFNYHLSITTMTGARAGEFQVLESIPIGSNRFPEQTVEYTRKATLARAHREAVYNNAFMQVTTRYVNTEGNF